MCVISINCPDFLLLGFKPDPRIVAYFDRTEDGLNHMCTECGWTTCHRGNLRAHVEAYHFSPWYDCELCGQTFKQRKTQIRHEKKCQFRP